MMITLTYPSVEEGSGSFTVSIHGFTIEKETLNFDRDYSGFKKQYSSSFFTYFKELHGFLKDLRTFIKVSENEDHNNISVDRENPGFTYSISLLLCDRK